jgi:hypothetical protein
MNEQIPGIENPEVFPYPKLIQTFNYFFPKEKGAPDIFTMENLRKFSRFAPYLALIILALMFALWIKDVYVLGTNKNPPVKYTVYIFFDSAFVLLCPIMYLWWMGASLFAKLVKRSPAIPLVMSFVDPLRAFGFICLIHSIGFIIGGLINLAA